MASAIITSVVTGGSNSHATVSSEANGYATDFVTQGTLGTFTNSNGAAPTTGSFGVNQNTGSDMNLLILGSGNTGSGAAVAYVTCTPSTQDKQVLRARMTADYTPYAINSNSSGATVYDWVYLSASATNATTPDAAADNVINLFTSRSTSSSSDTGSPPTYGILLAVVTVANGATAITNANISDRRTQATLNTGALSSTTGWNSLSLPLTYSAYNGNHSYNLTSSNDLTGTLSKGMRLNISRSVTPPTQCTSLNGTNQYYSKTSPAGMTFTNNFVVSAWVKMTSYNGAAGSVIASRFNGTSGWDFATDINGALYLAGYNGGAGNISYVKTYQSIPLNKWVHVAAQLDMATFTASPTTSFAMIDGVDVPVQISRGGTNPTSLAQLGNLEIGSRNGGLLPFPGKIAQVAIYSAKVTEANIAATISQGLVGTETNLISAYSFNNSIVDLNVSNANNLTANNGAVATATDSPFNAIEYGIITGVSYSNPTTTLTVQVPEGYAIPNQTLNSPQYSSQKVPFGFPSQRGKWQVTQIIKVQQSQSSPAQNTWYNLGQSINIPIGEWVTYYESEGINTNSTNPPNLMLTLSTANNSESDNTNSSFAQINGSINALVITLRKTFNLSLSAATIYYMNIRTTIAACITISYGADIACVITAECAYL
jgi:hypothetical protein